LLPWGLVAHKGAYLRNGWNVLDTIAVLASVLALAFAGNSEAKIVKVLRIVRVLRPLRTIQRFAGLQQVVNSMVKAIGNIWGLALVAVGFMFFFSVMGVSLFKGQFSYCDDPTTHYQTECNVNFSVTNEYNWTDTQDRKWETHFQNFDNTWNALATLASIITFEEARSLYANAMDSTSVGRGPELNYKREAILYLRCLPLWDGALLPQHCHGVCGRHVQEPAGQTYLRGGLEHGGRQVPPESAQDDTEARPVLPQARLVAL
jgi:hypothetical protein